MQHGFFFDQSRCYGCQACAMACKSWHGLPAGPLKYLRIYEYEKGCFPDVRVHYQWIPCYHCEEPVCVDNCPQEALHKEAKYGAVLVDSDRCDGCRLCYDSCPFGALVFESDKKDVKAQKCTMCVDRLEQDLQPVCVLACPTRALDFGPVDALTGMYGSGRYLEDLPSSDTTKPSVVFKPHADKKRLVAYDADKALRLLMKRDPLPPVFTSISAATQMPSGVVGRGQLVLKHESVDDLMRRTRNDEG